MSTRCRVCDETTHKYQHVTEHVRYRVCDDKTHRYQHDADAATTRHEAEHLRTVLQLSSVKQSLFMQRKSPEIERMTNEQVRQSFMSLFMQKSQQRAPPVATLTRHNMSECGTSHQQ